MSSQADIPCERVAAFIRQYTHDLRNGLNSLDLETALLRELVTDEEALETVERVRKQLRAVAEQMRSLSALFQEPQPLLGPLSGKDLLLIWREQHTALASAPTVEWVDELDGETVNTDVEKIAAIFRELLVNAAAFRDGEPALARAWHEGKEVIFELREPKVTPVDTSSWGRAFSSTRRSGYGLGLWACRRKAEASGAAFTQHYSPQENALVTRLALPAI